MSCLFYFLLHSKFFKGKVKSGIFGGFYWAFLKKNAGVFLGRFFITTTLSRVEVHCAAPIYLPRCVAGAKWGFLHL